MATYSSILTWEIPCTEEPCRLQFMELQRITHDWACDGLAVFQISLLAHTSWGFLASLSIGTEAERFAHLLMCLHSNTDAQVPKDTHIHTPSNHLVAPWKSARVSAPWGSSWPYWAASTSRSHRKPVWPQVLGTRQTPCHIMLWLPHHDCGFFIWETGKQTQDR